MGNQELGGIIIVPLLLPLVPDSSTRQQGSHKNVHKNLINHNLRCFMQGENHRIKIISPRDIGYA